MRPPGVVGRGDGRIAAFCDALCVVLGGGVLLFARRSTAVAEDWPQMGQAGLGDDSGA